MMQQVKHPPRHSQTGFTLIELLIAMAISAVVVVMAYQALNEAIKVQSVSDEHNQTWQQMETTQLLLNQDITQMVSRPVKDELGGERPALFYRQDLGLSLTRIASQPGLYNASGLMRLGYVLEQDELVRRIWPVLDRAPDTEPLEQVLLQNVESLNWRFLDHQNQWQTTWPPGNAPLTTLPVKVELSLVHQTFGELRRLWHTYGNAERKGTEP